MFIHYTVQMRNASGHVALVEVEIERASEADALHQADFQVACSPMAAWHESPWHAFAAVRAPGAWMWTACPDRDETAKAER